jgi:hypothetical protein
MARYEGSVASSVAWQASGLEKRRSHGQCELAECCRQAERRRDVGGEFVVSAADVLDEGMAGSDSCRRPAAFQSAHRPPSGLQPTMIGFDPVVAILLSHVHRGWDQFVEDPQVRTGPVGSDLDRCRPVGKGAGEEPACRGGVPLLRQQHVDDLPELVHRPVQIPPPASDLDIGLIDEPAVPGNVPERAGGVGEQRSEPLHSPVHRHVVDPHAPLGEQLLQIPVRQAVPQVPADRDRDHLRREPEPGKRRPLNGETGGSRSTHPPSFLSRARAPPPGSTHATDPSDARWKAIPVRLFCTSRQSSIHTFRTLLASSLSSRIPSRAVWKTATRSIPHPADRLRRVRPSPPQDAHTTTPPPAAPMSACWRQQAQDPPGLRAGHCCLDRGQPFLTQIAGQRAQERSGGAARAPDPPQGPCGGPAVWSFVHSGLAVHVRVQQSESRTA